jgi:hypothetical protein
MSVTAPATTKKPKRRASRYSEDEIERALIAVAVCAGNTHRAHRELAKQGHKIPRPTLDVWATRLHADRYQRIATEVVPKIHERIATEAEDLAQAYADAERTALDRLNETLDELDPKDVATAIRNLATSRGISIDKAALLRGRPTQIIEHRDPADIARELAAMRPDVFEYVDEDAEEITDADVAPDEHPALTASTKPSKTKTNNTAR